MPQRKRGRKPAAKKNSVTTSRNTPITEAKPRMPAAPAGLCEYSDRYWTAIGQQLMDAGVLTAVHFESFRVLCEVYGEYRRWNEWLLEDPARCTFHTETGYESETPQVRMRDRALSHLQKLWAKFGLTPLALVQLYKKAGMGKQVPEIEQFAASKYDEDEDAPPDWA